MTDKMVPATADGAASPIDGYKAWLAIGNGRKHLFFIHAHTGDISDYRSGYRVCSYVSASYSVAYDAVSIGRRHRDPRRVAAQLAVRQLIERCGQERFLAQVSGVPAINPHKEA